MKLLNKIFNRIARYRKEKKERDYNSARVDRRDFQEGINKPFPAGDVYWLNVAKHIKSVAEDKQENFFRDPEVILHLASENSVLGYRILNKIRLHPLGNSFINKCSTPAWGAPFILQNYPFLSPTTASHIANILSIYDSWDQKISSILDFGGGYGGFARCMAMLDPDIEINIVDLPEMQYVQNKFLSATTSFGNYRYFGDIDDLVAVNVDVFNASFSFSETPLRYREKVEKFIIKNSKSVHIIFQSVFNGIDNLEYMDQFRKRLEKHGWLVCIKKYDWYGWDSAWLLSGLSKTALKDLSE
jgi:hypothetical protein